MFKFNLQNTQLLYTKYSNLSYKMFNSVCKCTNFSYIYNKSIGVKKSRQLYKNKTALEKKFGYNYYFNKPSERRYSKNLSSISLSRAKISASVKSSLLFAIFRSSWFIVGWGLRVRLMSPL